jgi:hypothetical protein
MAVQFTYTPLASYTAPGGISYFSITNIPQNYTDLVIVANARTDYAGQTSWGISHTFNNVYTTNWSETYLLGSGSIGTGRSTTSTPTYSIGINFPAANATSGVFGTAIMHVQNYANTNMYKTVLVDNNSTLTSGGQKEFHALLWQNTAAITRFDVGASGNLLAGSTWTIYGIAAA